MGAAKVEGFAARDRGSIVEMLGPQEDRWCRCPGERPTTGPMFLRGALFRKHSQHRLASRASHDMPQGIMPPAFKQEQHLLKRCVAGVNLHPSCLPDIQSLDGDRCLSPSGSTEGGLRTSERNPGSHRYVPSQ